MKGSAEDSVWINVFDSTGTVHQKQIYHKQETVIPRYNGRHGGSNSSVDQVPENMRIYFFVAFLAVVLFFWWIIRKTKKH